MRILLINNNPVVSRLTALSARKEDIEIDEIQEVTELNANTYDIVFVDADSWTKDVRDVISENIDMKKSVLFYSDGDEDEKDSFDIAILKPFLPSEVSAVIRSVENVSGTANTTVSSEENFDILNESKKSLDDDLFDFDGLDDKKEEFAEVVNETSINSEESDIDFDSKLAEAFPPSNDRLEDDLLDDNDTKVELTLSDELITEETKKEENAKKDNDDELFDLELDEEIPSLEDDLFDDDKEIEEPIEKKEQKLKEREEDTQKDSPSDDLDEFVMDDLVLEPTEGESEVNSNISTDEPLELDTLEETPSDKQSTKILDEVEIAKIKGILTEDTSDEISLDSLMSTPEKSLTVDNGAKELETGNIKVDSDTLAKTLTSMPVEALRELLAGAKVHIKIKFPTSKK
jgi:hypothetical protein